MVEKELRSNDLVFLFFFFFFRFQLSGSIAKAILGLCLIRQTARVTFSAPRPALSRARVTQE